MAFNKSHNDLDIELNHSFTPDRTHRQPQPSLYSRSGKPSGKISQWSLLLIALIISSLIYHPKGIVDLLPWGKANPDPVVLERWEQSLLKCERLHLIPGPPKHFHERVKSDRFVEGTRSTLIRNATIWTGEDNGNQLLMAHEVLLDQGLIVAVGRDLTHPSDAQIVEAHGAWMTPGLFDMHAHVGVSPSEGFAATELDGNSMKGPVLPYLRSLDSLNTHDVAYKLIISGGVTTALVLPGSANSIGGQAFPIKMRETNERTPESKVIELPYQMDRNRAEWKKGDPPRWRHMKMACGENIKRIYDMDRMDQAWSFRSAFEKARKLKEEQDAYCSKAMSAKKSSSVLEQAFPDDLQWEALVDVLRGKVKVNTHCYEVTDMASFVRHTHEFKFELAAFHHAHEAYTVPDLLKSAYKGTPAVALFAQFARYKRESWRGSPYAAKIHSENNITVIMKSDHPFPIQSRFLAFEVQQAHHFGLPKNLALASVTTSPARVAGLDHRVGFIRKKYDADIVLWDSHPLSIGATPLQVWIDGIKQMDKPFVAKAVNVETEAPEIASVPGHVVEHEENDDGTEEGLDMEEAGGEILFTNVAEVLISRNGKLESLHKGVGKGSNLPAVLVVDGKVACASQDCARKAHKSARIVDLKGGSLLPPIVGFGDNLGLEELVYEKSTSDGFVFDPMVNSGLSQIQQSWAQQYPVHAVDGLQFGGRHLRIANSAGILKAITTPRGEGLLRGVSVAIRTGSKHKLEDGAIIKNVVALHIAIGHHGPTVSTEIQDLRRRLMSGSGARGLQSDNDDPAIDYFALAARGEMPLVIEANQADIIATIITLKQEIEASPKFDKKSPLRWIINGAQEAHILAQEIAEANISVILKPARPWPTSWESRRALSGPPLSPANVQTVLHRAGVRFGFGVVGELGPWQVSQLMWEASWAHKNSNGLISRVDAIKWISSNLEEMFGLPGCEGDEFVAYERDPFEFGSRAIAIGQERRGSVRFT